MGDKRLGASWRSSGAHVSAATTQAGPTYGPTGFSFPKDSVFIPRRAASGTHVRNKERPELGATRKFARTWALEDRTLARGGASNFQLMRKTGRRIQSRPLTKLGKRRLEITSRKHRFWSAPKPHPAGIPSASRLAKAARALNRV